MFLFTCQAILLILVGSSQVKFRTQSKYLWSSPLQGGACDAWNRSIWNSGTHEDKKQNPDFPAPGL